MRPISPLPMLPHPALAGATAGTASVHAGPSGLGLAALVSWLLAEGLGLYMFRSWLGVGGMQRNDGKAGEVHGWDNVFQRSAGQDSAGQEGAGQDGAGQDGVGQDGIAQVSGLQDGPAPGGMPGGLIVGHAALALAGFVTWVGFLAAGSPAVAWLAIAFLAPAIGLGISTVTVWTPYPVRRPATRARSPAPPAHQSRLQDTPGIVISNEMLDRVLASEALTGELVDDLVEKLLAEPGPPPQVDRGWLLAPVVPILHGVLAIATFLLATLAAINAVI